MKDILAITGLQGFTFDEFERSCSVGLPFGTQEHGILHVFIIKAVREFIQMRHEEHLDALFQSRTNDLPCDLRTFSFVRRGK